MCQGLTCQHLCCRAVAKLMVTKQHPFPQSQGVVTAIITIEGGAQCPQAVPFYASGVALDFLSSCIDLASFLCLAPSSSAPTT